MKRLHHPTFFLFLVLLSGCQLTLYSQAPTIQDCLGAIAVCQQEYVQTSVFSGYGSFNEIQDASGCPYSCMDGEKNSVWYIVTCQSSGMMSFEIDPVLASDDYDWGVFNLTNASCGDIYGDPSIQVACNAAGILGNTGSWTAMGGNSNCEDFGNTNQWCADIPVLEGETYVICVSNWTQSNEGYTLSFASSTANIYDNIKPEVNWVQESFGCTGETEMNFSFSEFVLCSSVNASDFKLIDPDGIELTIIDVIGEACNDGGTQEVDFKLVLSAATPIEKSGMHSLVIDGPLSDLCNNYANFEAFDFMVINDAPYVEFNGLPANACISDESKTLTANRTEGTYSISPDCGACLEDNGDGTASLFPALMSVGSYGVSFYYNDGLCDNDTMQVIQMNSLPAKFDLNPGGTFCEGSQGVEIILSGSESMVWYDLSRNGEYLESRLGTGNALSFNFWDIPGTYSVQASSFCGASTMYGSCVITIIPAPTIFDLSGPDFFCENTAGAVITLANSESGVFYELLLNDASLSPAVELPGVGGALNFPSQTTTGTYTVYAHNSGCDNMMNGSVILTEKPAPSAAYSFADLCEWLPTNFSDESHIESPGVINDFLWDFNDNGATSTDENPSHIFSHFGDFEVTLTVTSDFGCEDLITQTISIEEGINADAGDDEEINYGTSTTLTGSATGGSGNYSYHWEPAEYLVNPNAASTPTVLLEADQTFTLTTEDAGSECYGENTVTISVKGGPLRTDPSASAEYVCSGEGLTLHANAAGGNETYEYAWSSEPSGWNFDVSDPAISALTQSTTFFVEVDDGFNQVTESIYVAVKDNPEIYAGDDQEIPYNYFTQLQCVIYDGGSSFDFEWTPADKINGSNQVSNPITVALTENARFDVAVTNEFGCSATDYVLVGLSGGPLAANPFAEDNSLCQFDTLSLFGSASGGGLPHTYKWTVVPGDGSIISTEENPKIRVSEAGDYTYHVEVADLQSIIYGEVPVTVNTLPQLNLTSPFDSLVDPVLNMVAVCIYDTVFLDAGNSGFSYIWNTGSTEQTQNAGTTGIGNTLQLYYVDVYNETSGCAVSDTIRILYSFAMCTYSISELNGQKLDVEIYPNPFSNNLTISVKGIKKPTELFITDLLGTKYFPTINISSNADIWDHEFDFTGLPPGIYMVTFVSGGAVHSRKIVKTLGSN